VERVRFQLDEHQAHAIARAMRRRGIDIATADDAGTVGMPDDQLLAHCHAKGRVLVTNDNDFLALVHRGASHAGIVFWKQGSFTIGEVVDFLALIAGIYDPGEMAGRVEFVFRSTPRGSS
jgi:predicted nuclease of predicted toxin-antitoxin system